VPGEIRRAYHTAMQAPRGPVFVSVPMGDWDAEAKTLPERSVTHRMMPDSGALEEVARALAGARRPALVAGAGVARAGAFYDAVALAERLQAEVWADANSPLAGFPQDHPLFQGHLAFAQKKVAEQLSDYDVVLVLGAPVFLYYPYIPGPVVEEGTRVLQVTEDPEEANRAAVGEAIVGDVGVAIRRLVELSPEPDRPQPAAPDPPPTPEASSPMVVEYVMHVLSEVLPEETIVADESASSKAKLHQYVRPSRPGGYLTSAAGGLGYCLPAAVGLKLAQPERPVVCVIGEGSVSYSIQAIWSAARYGANVPVVVVNNGGYSILKGFRDALGIGDTVPGLDVPGVDFVRVAGGFGAGGERVEEAEALPDALNRALDADGPYLLDVIVDPEVPKLLG